MGHFTKVQLIKRKKSEQWYVSLPAPVARALEFQPSETVEWIVEDKTQLVLRRVKTPPSALKKKSTKKSSSLNSRNSGTKLKTHSRKNAPGKEEGC